MILTQRQELFAPDVSDRIHTTTLEETIEVVRSLSDDLVCVIDVEDEQATSAYAALRGLHPRAGFLILFQDTAPLVEDAANVVCLRWADLLRFDLTDDIARVRTRARVRRLREFAAGDEILPILVHNDPDPDAIASAFALRVLLRREPDNTPIVTRALMTRPENRRMAELLNVRITEISEQELHAFERVVYVDVQPAQLNSHAPRLAVLDHHPFEKTYEAEYVDVRPTYGAAATMMTEYLRADDPRRIHEPLATALLYAIKTDTAALTRGITSADVAAYAFLQPRADLDLMRRIEQPSNTEECLRKFGHALAEMHIADGIAAAWLGDLSRDEVHLLADLADLCLSIEEAVWAAAAARVDGETLITLRHTGEEPGAGALARALTAEQGSGGGHSTMARAALPADAARVEDSKGVFELVKSKIEALQ